jgi:hypothetical protein
MVRGESGKFGILGNVVSTSYGSHWAKQGSNPTLSAILQNHSQKRGFRVLVTIFAGSRLLFA